MLRSTLAALVFASFTALSACAPAPTATCDADAPAPSLVCEAAESAAVGPAGLPRTLTVVGTGSASVAPDVVHIHLGVQTRDRDVATAAADNDARLTRIRAALTALGVADPDMQLHGLTISIQTPFNPETGQSGPPDGYIVDNNMAIALQDPRRQAEVLTAALAAGATNVLGVAHTLRDPEALATRARELALADARARAEQIAATTGVALGRPLSIQETASGNPPYVDPLALGVAPALPGQVQRIQTVTISYRIP